MSEANGGSSGFVIGFFLGAATGGVAALLLAPKSGRELREELAEERARVRERAYEKARELKTRGARAENEARKAARVEGVKETAHILRTGQSRDEHTSPAAQS
jgi:gas vesicle protein